MIRVNLDFTEDEERQIKEDAEQNRRSMNAEIEYLVLKGAKELGIVK